MPSQSLERWWNESIPALDEIVAAHAAVGGTGRGRRYTTQQINQGYVVLLASRFQLFCRDLHTETAAELVRATGAPPPLQVVMQSGLTSGRYLDRGNPNPGNINNDFTRLGLDLLRDVDALHAHNRRRRAILAELMEWRNAIAHQDFNKPALRGRTVIHLKQVHGYRRVCNALATYFDRAALNHIHAVAGANAGW